MYISSYPAPRVQAATSATTVHRRVREGEIGRLLVEDQARTLNYMIDLYYNYYLQRNRECRAQPVGNPPGPHAVAEELIKEARRRYQRDRRFYPQEGLPDLIWQFAPPLVTGHLNDTGPAAFTVCVCVQN